jgi:hypothetical protein
MINRSSLPSLLAGILVVCFGATDSAFTQAISHGGSDRNEDTVLRYLRRVASSSDTAIRVYYLGACGPSAEDPVPFPFTKVQPPSAGKTGLAAVREIFNNDTNVTVTEDAGIIRIRIGTVPTDILRTKLSLLNLDSIAQYNPNQAIIAINNTSEMEAATRALGLSSVGSASSSRTLPSEELPHLPASIKNMTVEQILDLIAKTWDGPVIFGACTVPRTEGGAKPFFIGSEQDVIPKGAWKKMGVERPD